MDDSKEGALDPRKAWFLWRYSTYRGYIPRFLHSMPDDLKD